MVSDGVIISGATSIKSILSPGVYIHSGAFIEESVVFNDADIGRDARIRRTIIDKGARIPRGMLIGYNHDEDSKRFKVTNSGIVVVPKGYSAE